jgi:hypothetical protein
LAFKWILEVETKDATFESLQDSGKFETLDTKLGAAITELAKGDLGRQIVKEQEPAARERSAMVSGRQLLWIIYQHFAVDEAAGCLYNITDLMAVRLVDDQLDSFLHSWDHVLGGVEV